MYFHKYKFNIKHTYTIFKTRDLSLDFLQTGHQQSMSVLLIPVLGFLQ